MNSFVCYFRTALFLCLITSSLSSRADTAIADFRSIQGKLQTARKNHDWSGSVAGAKNLVELLNGAPDSILELARAKVHTGDFAGAFSDLEKFVQMGQSTDLLTANSGWDVIDDHGNLKPGAHPSAALIMRVSLNAPGEGKVKSEK